MFVYIYIEVGIILKTINTRTRMYNFGNRGPSISRNPISYNMVVGKNEKYEKPYFGLPALGHPHQLPLVGHWHRNKM